MQKGLESVNEVVVYLNKPAIKAGVKNLAGYIAFAGGGYAVYQIAKDKIDKKSWDFYLKLSCAFSAIVSPLGLEMCKWLAQEVVGPQGLPKPEIFALNPWQPRHVASLVANGFAMIGLVKLVYERSFKSFSLIQALVIFNFFTGRPSLHIANGVVSSRFRA